jgi:hypothetical protein
MLALEERCLAGHGNIMGNGGAEGRVGRSSFTWFLAESPTSLSWSEKATYEGVMRLPWSLAMISTFKGRV